MSGIVLTNMYVDTWRALHELSGATDAASPYINRLEGHLTRIRDSTLIRLQASGLMAQYEYYADIETDVRIGDVFKNFVNKSTGNRWYEVLATETWIVVDVTRSEPPFLEYKDIVLQRVVSGGPAPQG